MPPSTVFSYWRRDHRRTSPVPDSVSPVGGTHSPTTFTDAPPRLPGLPATTTLSETFTDAQDIAETSPLTPSGHHQTYLGDKRLSTVLSSQHSFNNLRVPSTATDDFVRPHSSPGDTAELEGLSSEQIQSQPPPPLSANGQPDIQSQKANGSWRLGFNRNGPNPQADDHRGAQPMKPVGKDLRINTNVDGGLGFVGGVMLKEMRTDGLLSGRDIAQHEQEHTIQQKHGKTKRHLLNPMSLLARRRSSQSTSSRVDEGNLGARNLVPAIPDDYDPRIRGNIVHDFSAPRPRPQLVGRDSGIESAKKSTLPSTSVQIRHSEHSPVFKEHFGEDRRALQIENKGFLQSSLLTAGASSDHDLADLPEFARRLPASLPEHGHQFTDDNDALSEGPLPPPSIQPTPRSSPQKVMEPMPLSSSIPIRLKSDASRFSFDMNGVGSSVQEKLLEEKHKEKEAARREKAQLERSSFSDFDDDDFDYDALEDDGGFEERIPGINADADYLDDQFQDFSGVVKNSEPPFIPILPTIAASPISPSYSASVMLTTTNNAHTPVNNTMIDSTTSVDVSRSASNYSREEDDVQHEGNDLPRKEPSSIPYETALDTLHTNDTNDQQYSLGELDEYEDDMYFDDGDIGDLPEDQDYEKIDESIFDNDSGQLYDRKFYPGTKIPVAVPEEDFVSVEVAESKHTSESQTRHVPSLASEFRPESWDFRNEITSTLPDNEIIKAPGGVLSEHNLEAFHSALARVADEAAAAKLQRNASVSETSLGQGSNSQFADSHPGLVLDEHRLSQTSGFDEVLDDFNYNDDDGFDDDLIIAEANADALENDDEEFYGQEFGFYARSTGNCEAEPIYGGYFGAQGAGGLNRSRSGGANFREPSLTPITERSEWSTRNSIISLTTHGPAAAQPNALTNPGLSQLVDMDYNDEDMSLGALMKLRRGAFGGSNGSLRSSTGSLSPQPAPVGASNRASFLSIPEDSPMDLNPNTEIGFQPGEAGSGLSSVYYNQSPLSEGQSLPGSPTLTLDKLTGGERSNSIGNSELLEGGMA